MKIRITLNDVLFLIALVAIIGGLVAGAMIVTLVGVAVAAGLFVLTLVRFKNRGGVNRVASARRNTDEN